MNELQNVVSEITTQNTSVAKLDAQNLPKLTQAELVYYQAKKSEVLAEMKENVLWDECLKVILKTFHNLNKDVASPSAKAEIQKLTQILRDLIVSTPQFSGITIGELNLAFDYGIRGEYGEFFGLNLKTFNQWVKGFENDEVRVSSVKKVYLSRQINAAFAPESKEVTDEEMAQCVLDDLRNVKQGHKIVGFTLFYDWCYRKIDIFRPTDEQRNETIAKVKNRAIYELKMRRMDKYGNSESITREIARLENGQYDKVFWNMCKIEHYIKFLEDCTLVFEKRLDAIINK